MSSRLAGFLAPVMVLFGAQFVQAQHHGGGGHMGGGMHMGGGHMGGMHMGGMHMGNMGHHYGGYGGLGGLGYGGYGYGGYGLGYGGLGYGGLGYGGLGYGGLGYGGYGMYSGYPYSNYGYPLGYGMGSAYYPRGYSTGYSSGAYVSPLTTYSGSSAPIASVSSTPAEAVITLNVPDGAKVWFNGKETAAKGGSVVFKSAVLQPGSNTNLNIKARWNDSTREMNLPITAGDKMSVDLRNQ